MKKTGIAFVGYGGMGVWHSNLLKRMDELELVGVYDIKEDRCELARSQGIYTYGSLEELLGDERVEIVSVIIPNHLHKDVCIQSMRAGKHVVCAPTTNASVVTIVASPIVILSTLVTRS